MTPTIFVRQGSLTDGAEDVLVNASNTSADLGSGVSGAIRRACGAGYQEHIHDALLARFGGSLEPAQVFVTAAGSHPTARFVAHVAVMDYRRAWDADTRPDAARIERACIGLWNELETIDAPSFSVAMVALGAGTGGLGVRIPTELACATLHAHLASHPSSRIRSITFYGYELYEAMAMAEVVTDAFPAAQVDIPRS